MRKQVSQLAVGDWVVLASYIESQAVSVPWKVTRIVLGSNHFIEMVREDGTDLSENERGSKEVKMTFQRHVKYAFTTEEAAHAVWEFSRKASISFDELVLEMRAKQEKEFLAHMQELEMSHGSN